MSNHFNKSVSAPPVSVSADAGIFNIRLVLAHYGECAQLVASSFWKEQQGAYCTVVPVFAVEPPRRELCSKQSLAAAYRDGLLDASAADQLLREFGVIPAKKAAA